MSLEGLGLGNISPAVLILGAGASRGGSFVARETGAIPPLDADFFLQLERLPRRSVSQRELLSFVSREFGPTGSRSMENVFSQLIASDEISALPLRRPGPHIRSYRHAADRFYEALIELLRETCGDRQCRFHETLVKRLQVGDTVISFNYDCVVDATLASNARAYGRWDPSRGYGYAVTAGSQYWGGTPLARQTRPIKLLKPHGSLNWQITEVKGGATLSLRQDPYSGSSAGRIIPPLAKKEISIEPFQSVWTAARDALTAAKALVVIGYSAPDVDPLSQALIRLHTANGRPGLRSLVLVDPSRDVRDRFRVLCQSATRPGSTSIHEFDRFEQLAKALG
jgi:hypothetical protein